MDRKLITITILTVTAVFLMIADFLSPPAHADTAVDTRDYQAVTARVTGGGEALYILDNRTGLIAVFMYDLGTRTLLPRTVRSVADTFK